MEQKIKTIFFSSLIVKLPLYVVLFCVLLCLANGIIGYRVFKKLFEEQYESITQQIACTALSYIDAEDVLRYEKERVPDEAWYECNEKLDKLTITTELAFIYVTIPDESYESRVYIFDTVHPDVINGKAYPLGQVNSLKKYEASYVERLKKVMDDGTPYIRFAYTKTGGHVTTAIPVKDASGTPVAILSIVKPMSEIKTFKSRYLKVFFISSALITALFILVYIFILVYTVVRPIRLITHETAHFARHKGFLSGKLKQIRGNNELGILSRAVEKMSVDMQKYIDDLTHATAEKERLSAELNVATQIQANMLPQIFPPYSRCPDLELYATMDPAKEVGGDFYDFFMIDDDHFAIIVGDVSGKGVPAALFMVIAKTLLKNACVQKLGPAQIFELVNNQLCEGNDAGLFVTCWLGILRLSTGELRFANAGHTPPLWCHEGSFNYLHSKPNLMLAGMEGAPYKEHSVVMAAHDRLFVYTDGITEATNASNELYGEERLLSAIQKTKSLSTRDALDSVRKDIDAFVKEAAQFDDITMLELLVKEK